MVILAHCKLNLGPTRKRHDFLVFIHMTNQLNSSFAYLARLADRPNRLYDVLLFFLYFVLMVQLLTL